MNVRNLLTVNAVYVTLIALMGIFLPNAWLEFDGAEATTYTINLARIVGAASVGYGVTSWLMRNARPSVARQAFLLGGGAGYVVMAMIFTANIFTLGGVGNGPVVGYIILSLLLGGAFLYLGLQEPAGD